MKKTALASMALTACCVAHAGMISTRLGTIQPYTGMYYDPHQSGSGLSVDVGPGGMLFLQFASYDTGGNQVNYIVQPNYTPSSEAELDATGNIGTATSSPFYQALNGQCPGCVYRAQSLSVTSIVPMFTWTSARHVDMSFPLNGTTYTYHFQAANYEGKTDEEFLPGSYAVSLVNDDSVYPGAGPQTLTTLPTDIAVMTVAPAAFDVSQLSLDPTSSADIALPPATAHLYTLQCAGSQMGADDNACFSIEMIFNNAAPGSRKQQIPLGTERALLWYDPASATAGMELYRLDTSGKPIMGPANFHGRLYITPALLQTHLKALSSGGATALIDGTIGAALTFTRLPQSAVRDCYDYPAKSCQ